MPRKAKPPAKKRRPTKTLRLPRDSYHPVTRDDVTDLALLPRRFDVFAAEVRTSFELLRELIVPALTEIKASIAHLCRRVEVLEQNQLSAHARLDAAHTRIEALERSQNKEETPS